MKNQYCGDTRDLFKYDLVEHLCKKMGLDFTFIPMLTPNDNRNDGNKRNFAKAKAGYLNENLMKSLKPCHATPKEKRNFKEIRNYYEAINIKIEIYEHDKSRYFTHKGRTDYFRAIKTELLKRSLIFLDPDNGLEVKNNKDKHVLYSEVKSIYDRMTEDSLLVIFQFKPREELKKYIARRANALHEKVGDSPLFISDNEVIFFILSKDLQAKALLKQLIAEYDRGYKSSLVS